MTPRLFSFPGGTHPRGNKHFTENKPVEPAKIPAVLVIPMLQHIGAPCEPTVQPGERVDVGQMIGMAKGLGAPVHASVSGTVTGIQMSPHPAEGEALAVVIANDGEYTPDPSLSGQELSTLTQVEIKELIFAAGIVGMGGAALPTHIKLNPPPDKPIDTVILNGAECEPYLTADHWLMLEQSEAVVFGLQAIMQAVGAKQGLIGIEDNKPDSIRAMSEAVRGKAGIRVVTLPTKYPQGAEKQLITAVTRREVPSGGLPPDIGVVVNNVATAAAVATAIRTGMPLIERIVTVTGAAVREPKNLLVRIGTSFQSLIDQCGGFTEPPVKVIAGGPVMGLAQADLRAPVIKETGGIVALTAAEAALPPEHPCIRCGKCLEACPIRLMPLTINAMVRKGDYPGCTGLHVQDCIECGSCAYVCPAKIPLLDSIREAKKAMRHSGKTDS